MAARVRLTAAEWAAFVDLSGSAPPPGFAATRPACVTDVVMGIFRDGRPIPLVAGALGALARPSVGVQVEISVSGAGLRAFCAVAGASGVALIRTAGDGVELSAFPAPAFGRELVRLVPERTGATAQIARALGGKRARPVLGGLLSLHAMAAAGLALDDPRPAPGEPDAAGGPAFGAGGDEGVPEGEGGRLPGAHDRLGATSSAPGMSALEARLARRVAERTVGVLRCMVLGPAPARPEPAAVAIGQVLWLATDDGGWVGVRPEPAIRPAAPGAGGRLVRLVPVRRVDLGSWLAPHVAAVVR